MAFTFITSGRLNTFAGLIDTLAGVFADEPHLLCLCGENERCALVFQNAWCALWLDYQNGEG